MRPLGDRVEEGGPVIFVGRLIASGDAGEGGTFWSSVVGLYLASYRVLGSEAASSSPCPRHTSQLLHKVMIELPGASYPHPTVALGQVAVLCCCPGCVHLPLQQLCLQRGRSRAMACPRARDPGLQGFHPSLDSPPAMHGPWAMGERASHGGLRAARENPESGPLELASLPALGALAPGSFDTRPPRPHLPARQAFACPFSPCLHVLSRPYTAKYLGYLGLYRRRDGAAGQQKGREKIIRRNTHSLDRHAAGHTRQRSINSFLLPLSFRSCSCLCSCLSLPLPLPSLLSGPDLS